jgi:hypothetical protein
MAAAKTIRTGTLGKRVLRLVSKDGRYFGLADGKVCVEGEDPERVWHQLQNDSGKSDARYFGYKGAVQQFLKFFPGGFHSAEYLNGERDYKEGAKTKLEVSVPLELALHQTGYGEAVLSAFRSTNLLSPFEKARVQDVLRSNNADEVVQAAAAFTINCDKNSLARLEAALKPYECAKWTVATYLPFFWRPEQHMFLKPEVTKDYAARVGHPLATVYDARLDYDVYCSLLDLAKQSEDALRDLQPRDRIDIQSFIWVVGAYRGAADQV